MTISQTQADALIARLKEASRRDTLDWAMGRTPDELVVAVDDGRLHFLLSLNRYPFDLRFHFRTRDRNIGLVRLHAAPLHLNPDGTELRGQPHLHVYRAGHELAFAEPVDWYDVNNPLATLGRFLDVIQTRFPFGIQLDLA
ncbi:MAG: hypothetical protein JNM50_02970 [Chromatiales bacterium]|nr:hypothetical protein [Chromatiales bacterium]